MEMTDGDEEGSSLLGSNCTSPCTHVSAGVSGNKSLPDLIPYPCFQKQLTGRGNVHSQAVPNSSY